MESSGAFAPERVAGSPVGGSTAAGAARRRSGRGRFVHVLSTFLVIGGLILVCDIAAIAVWQEPISALYARIQQQHLADQLAHQESSRPTTTEARRLAGLRDDTQRIALLARELRTTAARRLAVGRIVILSLRSTLGIVNRV